MIKVGLTGNIGSGKSTVAKIFKALGVPVFSADEAGKEVLKKPEVIKIISSEFGEKVLSNQHKLIDRKRLAEIVFSDNQRLTALNNIIHPLVRAEFLQWLQQHLNHTYILHEAAILIESGFFEMFDKIILVKAPEQLRIQRVKERDHAKTEDVINRIKNQMPETEKEKFADLIIDNDEKKMLIPQVLSIHKELTISAS